MHKRSISVFISAASVVIAGCESNSSGSGSDPNSVFTGGAISAGGASSASGTALGGATNNGTAAIGGVTNAGGVVGMGGTSVIGGTTSAGGAITAGGNVSAGGATATGGAAGATAGGATSTGVSSRSGGATAAGGAIATGGATAAGATATGGATAAGGTTSKGGATATGGASTGGSGKGGTVSTGGAATGGATTGGATGTGGSGGGTTVVAKKFIGNLALKNKDIQTNFATKWQQVTMEANSKWGFVQPDSADKWVWEPVDKVYEYAMDNGLIFKEHNFFWNLEQPSWVNDSNVMTVAPVWIETFCKRYPKTAMIDVVNEPQHNPPPYKNGMGGSGTSGFDWVVQAFKWARQYCPGMTLILNEYNIIEYDADHTAFISMLQKVLAAGAPVDAIGAQGHDVYKIGYAKAKTYLDKLATTFPNMPIYITELDIDQADDTKQADMMRDEITMFWEHPSVYGITYWGYLKGAMWRTNAWLEDANGTPRPAMTWLQDFMKSH